MQLAKRIAMLVADEFEDLEFWYPVLRAREAGHHVTIIGHGPEHYRGKFGLSATADAQIDDVQASDFEAVIIPGGWAPDKMRRFPALLSFVRDFDRAGKPVATICHAGWVLVSADICRGRTLTSTPGIKDDLVNAGATWVDEPAMIDGNFVSARRPPDLPDFMRAFLQVLDG